MQSSTVISVIDAIQVARDRQIDGLGRNLAHEDLHADGQMARAAACYALSATKWQPERARAIYTFWPWVHPVMPVCLLTEYNIIGGVVDPEQLSPEWAFLEYERRCKDLLNAAALLVAEIERLDRRAGYLRVDPVLDEVRHAVHIIAEGPQSASGELAAVAACFALSTVQDDSTRDTIEHFWPWAGQADWSPAGSDFWPWDSHAAPTPAGDDFWSRGFLSEQGVIVRAQLVYAVAALAVEIDRSDLRAGAGWQPDESGGTARHIQAPQARKAALVHGSLAFRSQQTGDKTTEDAHLFASFVLHQWAATSMKHFPDNSLCRAYGYRDAAYAALKCGRIADALALARQGDKQGAQSDITIELQHIAAQCSSALEAEKAHAA